MSEQSSPGRTVLVLVVILSGLQLNQADHQLGMAVLLTLSLALALLAATGRLGSIVQIVSRLPARGLARTAVVLAGVATAGQVSKLHSEIPIGVAICLGLALLASLVLAAWTVEHRWADRIFAALLVTVGAVMLVLVLGYRPIIDVQVFLDQGASRLLHLESPYGGTSPNPYTAEESSRFFGPDVIGGDRILVGFPYLPASLLPALVGHVLGDVRIGALLCILLTAVVVRRLSTDEVGRTLALLTVVSPLTVLVLTGYWVEPAVALFLALGVLGLRERRPVLGALGIGLLLASKQYLLVALPLLLLLRRRVGMAAGIGAVGLTAALCAVFFAAGPSGFLRDVLQTQLSQPFRPDSISLLVAWGNAFGQPPAWLTGLLPLVAGLAVSAALVRWSRLDEATTLALVVGLSLLATVLLSKQGFANYFYLVQAALAIAAVTWSRAESSGESGGESGGASGGAQRDAHHASSRSRATSGSIGPSSSRSSSSHW